jgi:hypothetical protein
MPMARRSRSVAAAGAFAVAGLVVLVLAAAPWRARAAVPAPTCSPGQLHLKFIDFQGATGHRFWDFAFKNTGSKCTVKGYPKVVLLDSHGHALSAKVKHLAGSHAKAVTVGHNKRAFFTFQYADSGFCSSPPVIAHKFELSLPGAHVNTVFNPVPKNMGPASMCKGSEFVWPLRATSGPTADAAGTPVCAPSGLRLDKIGGQGFTSHREIAFALRNVTAQTCHLKGYPGVGLLDHNATLLSPSVTRVPGPKPTLVLHTWQRAFFNVVYVVGDPCIPHTITVFGLQVTPPANTGHLVYYLGSTSLCSPPSATVTALSHHPGP